MKRLILALGVASTFVLPIQATRVRPALPGTDDPEIAARIGAEVITMAEYRDYLVRAYGREPLGALIDRRLLRNEARRLEVSVSDEDRAQAVDRVWQSYLVRLRGDEEAFIAELEQGGFHVDEYRALLSERATDELLLQAICIRIRVVTDERIEERYRRDFGPDGDRVDVRHVFLNPARERSDLIQQGVPAAQLEAPELEKRIREKCARILQKLEAGADFGTVAAEEGHDVGARATGGVLANYNYRAYGETFAAAVRAAEVGVPTGPIRTEAGFHVIEVMRREHTDLEDVRETLRKTLAEEPASFAETEALRAMLRARVEIETY